MVYRAYYVHYRGFKEEPTFQNDISWLLECLFSGDSMCEWERQSVFQGKGKSYFRSNMKKIRFLDIFYITEDNTAVWAKANVRKLKRRPIEIIKTEKISTSNFIYVGTKVTSDGYMCTDSKFLVDTNEISLLNRLKAKHPGWDTFSIDKYAADSMCGEVSYEDKFNLDEYHKLGPEASYRQYLRMCNCIRYIVHADGRREDPLINSDDYECGKGMRHFMIPEFFEHMQLYGNHMYYWNLSDIKHDAQNEGYLSKIQYLLDADARHPDYGNVYTPSVFIP